MSIIRHILCIARGGNLRWHLDGIRREAWLALALLAALVVAPIVAAAVIVSLTY